MGTFPLETRTAGFFFAVSSNMLFTFIIAQAFLSMMCHLRAGIFFFFAAWIVVMGLFAMFLLPETKNVPIDEMTDRVWKQHWYWKRYMMKMAMIRRITLRMVLLGECKEVDYVRLNWFSFFCFSSLARTLSQICLLN